MRCRNDEDDDNVDVIEVEYLVDAGEVSLALRPLRLASPVGRCDVNRDGDDGDLSKIIYFKQNVSIALLNIIPFGCAIYL